MCSRQVLPEKIPSAFEALIREAPPQIADILRREIAYSDEEKCVKPYETTDPLGEKNYAVGDFAVHQYANRLLVLTTGRCLGYCRYCFRRDFTARQSGFLSENQQLALLDYLRRHPEISEVLLSGGDPLSGTFEQLQGLIAGLRSVSEKILIRICTRAIIFAPEVFTERLVALLSSAKPLWLIPHINHPAELGVAQIAALARCTNAGIPIQSQTVLLRGINDKAETLAELFNTLVRLSVKPGYLFQLDTAYGTSHFAVAFNEAINLWKKLLPMLTGLSRPEFAVDLLEGAGKFSLSSVAAHSSIRQIDKYGFSVSKEDGTTAHYSIRPRE